MAKNVCIFGSAFSSIDPAYLEAAYRVGALLAERDIGMVFGGGNTGVMGAAARGIHENGGRLIGVIPEKLNQPGIAYPHCDELIVTADMHSRKATMEKLSCGFIAMPGGFGTLEELLEVLTLNQLGYISCPVVLLNTRGYYNRLIDQLKYCVAEGFIDPACMGIFAVADTPLEAVELTDSMQAAELPDKMKDALRSAEGKA
ncbi:MAG: TIGR00730 family Rossman fold protein [Clostridia bacterium]|nr:TIGR00730 family Rossman fold protein [Clostridia bacterium]MBQ4610944.1 TIGR00730 family Rossman fold protein [Clostridia bacterium]MBQ6703329.1 TIGR00730 family Rossman fold protein [Clostridia bacterium]